MLIHSEVGMRLFLCILPFLCVSVLSKEEVFDYPIVNKEGKISAMQFFFSGYWALYGNPRAFNYERASMANYTTKEMKEKYDNYLNWYGPVVHEKINDFLKRIKKEVQTLPNKRLIRMGNQILKWYDSRQIFAMIDGFELGLWGMQNIQKISVQAAYNLWKTEHRISADVLEICFDNFYDPELENDLREVFNTDKNSTLYFEGVPMKSFIDKVNIS